MFSNTMQSQINHRITELTLRELPRKSKTLHPFWNTLTNKLMLNLAERKQLSAYFLRSWSGALIKKLSAGRATIHKAGKSYTVILKDGLTWTELPQINYIYASFREHPELGNFVLVSRNSSWENQS